MITLASVEKRYGSFQALQPLDLDVHDGEVFGFLGPNGAGKTTTIRMLSGVLKPTAGRIHVDGIDIVEQPVESRRRIGYIPDRPYLYEKLTAREFLQFVGGSTGWTAPPSGNAAISSWPRTTCWTAPTSSSRPTRTA